LLCDVDANSVAGLKLAARELSLDDRVRCLVADGVSAIRRATMGPHAPEPARVLVHVDPFDPFEPSAADEVTPLDLVCELAQRGFTVVLWYGYEDKQRGPGWAWREVASRLPRLAPPLWYGDIGLPLLPTAAGEAGRGLRGCGVVCANLSEANCATLATLGAALASIYQHTTAPTGESDALVFRSLSH
jgi:hypothetical protein